MTKRILKFDKIGYWSQIKLDIIKAYASAYSKILTKQKKLYHIYIDAFSGSGIHIGKDTHELIEGSPLIAVYTDPPFNEYHFIDLDKTKINALRKFVGERDDVYFYDEDCNTLLVENIFPRARYEYFKRALCLLDPYGLHLNWKVIETAGKMKSIEIFLNFPVADMNRNVLWRDPKDVNPSDIERMNKYWGDDSWREIAYTKQPPDLFGYEKSEKNTNEFIAQAFRKRLEKIAGFEYVPKPIPMRNSRGATIYYLFFASQNRVGRHIIEYIFNRYRDYKK